MQQVEMDFKWVSGSLTDTANNQVQIVNKTF